MDSMRWLGPRRVEVVCAAPDQDALDTMLRRHGLVASAPPQFFPDTMTAHVDVLPHGVLPDLDTITVGAAAGLDEQEVDDYLEHLRQQAATFEPLNRPAIRGDWVRLDLAATVAEVAVDHGRAHDVLHEVGRDHALPGLDEAVTGLGPGDVTTIETVLVGGPQQGRTATVSLTVRAVLRRVTPALGDEFAARIGEFTGLAELRAAIRARLVARAADYDHIAACRSAVRQAADAAGVAAPESLVRWELRRHKDRLTAALGRYGVSMAECLTAEGATEDEADAELSAVIAGQLRAELTLDLIAHRYAIGATDAEVAEEARRPGPASRTGGYDPSSPRANVLRGKALVLLMSRVRTAHG
ncbi:hypothetical protein Daura_20765 [Dactylosporangium aurantiacum]|uniref:Trigger factor C-terminal domain-containing protein n=1 Tax=Dactylosporangium aurantiacum TaxID=35754 RepID=A0A9Q9ILK5_9ACTN|nr:hypothetical protein [Dactylosporangium aurantiacum]MDG6109996.1 hypothetical protein [Dactylosporangium aurantiacum]UWZ58397.1 hypothetical protein Daura_20765 [Dactylosporangium aurantiacum]